MYDDHRVVVMTPAGRQRYLEVLIPQILKLRPLVDEYRLWVNTENVDDIAYMEKVAEEHKDFIKLDRLTVKYRGNLSVCSFFPKCVDPKTVYVRFDDDVVLLDSKDAFLEFVKFRINHPEYFIVFGNILNNAILTHIHQDRGTLNTSYGKSEYKCMCDVGWKSGEFAVSLHKDVLSKPSLEVFRFVEPWVLKDYERVSINCISWLGSEFEKFGGVVGIEDEEWLSCVKPKQLNRPNVIYGGFVVVHFAFYPQRSVVDKTDLLKKYEEIARKPSTKQLM